MHTAILDECTLIEDRRGNLWLGVNELQRNGYRVYNELETIQVEDEWYDVVGFSDTRQAFWVQPIVIEGAAETIEEELSGSDMGGGVA